MNNNNLNPVLILVIVLLGILLLVSLFSGRNAGDALPEEVATTSPATTTPAAEQPAAQTTTVNIYYYDAARDTVNGNVLCSARGLVAVPRTIPATEAPLRASLEQLLASEPAGQGLTPFPAGVGLEGVTVSNGVATVRLSDPNNRTSGGACQASINFALLEATARQFSSVKSVRVEPEDLFQP